MDFCVLWLLYWMFQNSILAIVYGPFWLSVKPLYVTWICSCIIFHVVLERLFFSHYLADCLELCIFSTCVSPWNRFWFWSGCWNSLLCRLLMNIWTSIIERKTICRRLCSYNSWVNPLILLLCRSLLMWNSSSWSCCMWFLCLWNRRKLLRRVKSGWFSFITKIWVNVLPAWNPKLFF